MKAVSYTSTGDSDVLTLGERPEPHAGDGEVRVRIHVSGVNPTDWKSRQGSGPTELPRPQVPNQDGAGVVDEVGPGVSDVAVGDRVWVWDAAYQRPDGTAQELVVLPRKQVVALPDDVGFDVGASLGIPALTAHLALTFTSTTTSTPRGARAPIASSVSGSR
jgi:NADPH2:quinone reductase